MHKPNVKLRNCLTRQLTAAAWGAVCLGCSLGPITPWGSRMAHSPQAPHSAGILDVLTYNVAGLPAMLSPSNPDVNSRAASPHFNRYDIVLAQEDFTYHEDLVHAAAHPFQLGPRGTGRGLVGDGLTTLSNYPVVSHERRGWQVCNGYLFSLNDCLGEKGFSVAQVTLGSGQGLHVYNLHADAGTDSADVWARLAGFEQLAEFINAHSRDVALIVGGDTNLDSSDPRDQAILEHFLQNTGLRDACLDVGCAELQIDHIFFRSSDQVALRVEDWHQDRAFVDSQGQALSDHPAIAVRFSWATPEPAKKPLSFNTLN